MASDENVFNVGDDVCKTGGDYEFYGEVTCVFYKKNTGAIRYVVEDDRGCVHIFSGKMLTTWNRHADAVNSAG